MRSQGKPRRKPRHRCTIGLRNKERQGGESMQATISFDALRRAACACLFLSAVLVLSACQTDVLEVPAAPPPSTKHAALVVDAGSGRTLLQESAYAPRRPASLTKMMTLYLLFEALESGRVTLSTRIPVSAEAASRPPTRIGFKRGQDIDVDTAIKALVVKSANDVATAVAEYLGGSEASFAATMTAKARQIGMTGTVFRNASGLPDPGQWTTARDMAVLGMALMRRFPDRFHYFSLRDFSYGNRLIRGHNKLLQIVDGVDGIKTGYIRDSGFNVVTSFRKNGRRLIVVVMGGDTARSRDAEVAGLIERFDTGGSLPGVAGMSATR